MERYRIKEAIGKDKFNLNELRVLLDAAMFLEVLNHSIEYTFARSLGKE